MLTLLCTTRCIQASTDRFAAPTASTFTFQGRTCLGMPHKPSRSHVRHAFEHQKSAENDRLEHPNRCGACLEGTAHNAYVPNLVPSNLSVQSYIEQCYCRVGSSASGSHARTGTSLHPAASGTKRNTATWQVCNRKLRRLMPHRCGH